jgi:hypothetical protein
MLKRLEELCKRNGYNWKRNELINENVDPEFDNLVTKAREHVSNKKIVSHRHFYKIHNSRNFLILSDLKDGAKGFERFAEMLVDFTDECEFEKIE